MAGFKPSRLGEEITQADRDLLDSFTAIPDGSVPQMKNGKAEISGQNVDPTTGEHTLDKSLNLPQASAGIGLVDVSEAGGFLIISNPLSPTQNFVIVDSRIDDTGSFPPRYFNTAPKRIEVVQAIDTTVITTNPLPFSITTNLLAQTNKLFFKADSPMTNVSMKITDNATGTIIKHVPSKAVFESGTGGISLITGVNTIDFNSKLADTPGVTNLGVTPFRLFPSTPLDIIVKADSIALKGNASEVPAIDAEVQDAKFTDLAIISQLGLSSLFIPVVNSDGELTDSSIRENPNSIQIAKNHTIHIPTLVDTTPQTISRPDVFVKTTVTATVTAGQFTAGSDNGPNVVLDSGTPVFAPGEFLLIEGDTENDGIYETSFNLGALLELRGFGGVARVEDWTLDQVVTKVATVTITKVKVSVERTSLTGTIEHGEGDTAPIAYFRLAHAADVPIVVVEEFAAKEASFNSELGLPGAQGFTDIVTGTGTISLQQQTVFGITKNAIVYDIPVSGDSAKSVLALSQEDWDFNLLNGFSFRGEGFKIVKDIDTQSCFAGAGFSTARDPRPTSIQSRVGIFKSVDATHSTIRLDGQSTVTLNGIGGVPLVFKDTHYTWEIFVNKTPDAGVNFGAATLFVNDVQVSVGAIIASNSAVNDEVSVANSSGSGTTTFSFVNFGVTIYQGDNIKTLSVAAMQADIAQIKRPRGKRDHTVILPDGNPRKLGNRLEFLGGSASTKLFLQTENPSVPQALFNGLNEVTINVVSAEPIDFINVVDNANIYTGRSQILNQQPLGAAPGSVNYDPIKGTMNVRNRFAGSSIQVGQEEVRFVVNKTGVTINEGEVVHVEGYDSTTDALTIGLSIADLTAEARVTGVATTTMIDDAIGLVTLSGRVNDLDTSSFVEGDVIFLSDTTAGGFTSVAPVVEVQLGIIGKVDVSEGFIDLNIKTTVFKSAIGTASSLLDQFANDVSDTFIDFEIRDLTNVTWDNTGKFFKNNGATTSKFSFEPQIGRRSTGTAVVVELFGEVSDDDGATFTVESLAIFKQTTNNNSSVSPITTNLKPGNCVRYGMILSGDIASSGIISNGQGATNPGVSISGRTVPSVALTII